MVYQLPCDLKEAYETECNSVVKQFQKTIMLRIIDDSWKENLRQLDELKHSVQNASYEQKDPLLIYKLESFQLFKHMLDETNRQAVSILMRGQIPVQQRAPEEVQEAAPEKKDDYSKYSSNRGESSQQPQQQERRVEPVRSEPKIGRNDPCPCGSGKKFKHCHGKDL